MQQTTGVAVLATHLAQTDRRALSQAWYDALHLAGARPTTRAQGTMPSAPPACASRGRFVAPDVPLHAPGATSVARERRGSGTRSDAAPPAIERRAPKSELARRIERELARRDPRTIPASFAVRAAGGRVRILVRSEGARTRVLAVCTPPLREGVERALAQARFALAARGFRAEGG
jgi:hypothetical protein